MKRLGIVVAFITVFSIGGPPAVPGGKLDPAKWSHVAPIKIQGHPAEGLLELSLPPQVFDHSQPALEDLRVVGDSRDEIGYVIKDNQAKSHTIPLKVELYNRTHLPGRSSSVTLDFGERVKKNQLQVQTAGSNFRRRVTIEGSDDGEKWQVVKATAFLFRIPGDGGKTTAYDRSVVPIPSNDQRYLKITVFNGEDDDGPVTIEEVKACRKVSIAPVTTTVSILTAETIQKKRTTEIILDLGHRNMPLYEISLNFSDPNFFRKVTLFGRNSKTRVVRYPVEDSPAHEKTLKVPWSRITEGTVFRFSSRDDREESLKISLKPAQYRYLKARVDNRDDPPLNFTGAKVIRLVKQLEFQPKGNASYELYTGNPKAAVPAYDLGHYVGRLRKEGVAQASLGDLIPNPAHKAAERKIPWSERYRWLLWIALLGILAVLALLVYRVAASPPPESRP
jgi:hypothetical protein